MTNKYTIISQIITLLHVSTRQKKLWKKAEYLRKENS